MDLGNCPSLCSLSLELVVHPLYSVDLFHQIILQSIFQLKFQKQAWSRALIYSESLSYSYAKLQVYSLKNPMHFVHCYSTFGQWRALKRADIPMTTVCVVAGNFTVILQNDSWKNQTYYSKVESTLKWEIREIWLVISGHSHVLRFLLHFIKLHQCFLLTNIEEITTSPSQLNLEANKK